MDAKARFLSFNRTQSRALTGLLTGHNTLRRHLHQIGLLVHCVGGVEQRMNTRLTFFMNVKLWLHSDMCIWSPFWSHRTSRV